MFTRYLPAWQAIPQAIAPAQSPRATLAAMYEQAHPRQRQGGRSSPSPCHLQGSAPPFPQAWPVLHVWSPRPTTRLPRSQVLPARTRTRSHRVPCHGRRFARVADSRVGHPPPSLQVQALPGFPPHWGQKRHHVLGLSSHVVPRLNPPRSPHLRPALPCSGPGLPPEQAP